MKTIPLIDAADQVAAKTDTSNSIEITQVVPQQQVKSLVNVDQLSELREIYTNQISEAQTKIAGLEAEIENIDAILLRAKLAGVEPTPEIVIEK